MAQIDFTAGIMSRYWAVMFDRSMSFLSIIFINPPPQKKKYIYVGQS